MLRIQNSLTTNIRIKKYDSLISALPPLNCLFSLLATQNTHGPFNIVNENLAVAFSASVGCFTERFSYFVAIGIGTNNLNLCFWRKINNVVCGMMRETLIFLPAKAFRLDYRHTVNMNSPQRFLYLAQHKWLNISFNFLHFSALLL